VHPAARDPEALTTGAGLEVTVGRACISVFTAKRPGSAWNKAAQRDIERARESYRRAWGDVPLWDEIDERDTTFHYIAYVTYCTPDGKRQVEALTGRLVLEEPDDVTFFVVGERAVPLKMVLAERFGTRVAGDSRIGSVRPFGFASNAYTLEAFAAIKLLEMADARAMHVEHIACQLRPELGSRVLCRGDVSFGFPRTECLLQLESGGVRLDRANARVVRHLFEYPGYFLDQADVRRLLHTLVDAGQLTIDDLQAIGLSNQCDVIPPRSLRRLVPYILSAERAGTRLREGIMTGVGDGVYSSVASTAEYEGRARRVLDVLGARIR
jgi:hypothetical protein